jgi:cell division protein ZapA (FtsZ GTPase activity inhibitor)
MTRLGGSIKLVNIWCSSSGQSLGAVAGNVKRRCQCLKLVRVYTLSNTLFVVLATLANDILYLGIL